jgi:hypothetical protein
MHLGRNGRREGVSAVACLERDEGVVTFHDAQRRPRPQPGPEHLGERFGRLVLDVNDDG